MKEIVKLENVSKAFGRNQVLKDISITINKGDSLAIIGASGTGKSVTLKLLLGLLPFDAGSIKVFDQELKNISIEKRDLLMKKVGVLFQGGALFDSLPIWRNISFSLIYNDKMDLTKAKDIAIQKLYSVGLKEDVANLFPAEISGGMQKRVALARAICNNPQLITFDEPTTGLDPIMSDVIDDIIIKSSKELGATTITISHDMASVRKIATHIAMLHEGEVIWYGKKEELDTTDNPYVRQFVNGSAVGPIKFTA